jgi:rhodanese-related sulfurtransferase
MSVKRVSPEEAKRLMDEGYVYLDVRSIPEFEQGHPAGAYNVPLKHMTPGGMTPNPDFLAVVDKAFAKDTRIVVGCRSGGRSLSAAEAMAAAGFTNVVDQKAGFAGATDQFGRLVEPGWQPRGLPVDTSAKAGRSYHELAQKAGKG